MDRRLLQILNNTACLSKNQLQGYVNNTLQPEELYAVEMHLIECPICNDAIEGLSYAQNTSILNSLKPPTKLPSIKSKDKKIAPTNNNNKNQQPSAKPTTPNEPANKIVDNKASVPSSKPTIASTYSRTSKNWLINVGIAAAVLIGFGTLWYVEFYKPTPIYKNKPIAANNTFEEIKPSFSSPQDTSFVNEIKEDVTKSETNTAAAAADTNVAVVKNINQDAEAKKSEIAVTSKTQAKSAETAEVQLVDKSSKPKADTAKSKTANAKKEDIPKPAPKPTLIPAAAEEKSKETKEVSNAKSTNNDDASDAVPKISSSDYDKGMSFYRQQQYGSAILYLRNASRNTSGAKQHNALYHLGLSYKNTGRRSKAKEIFEQLVKNNTSQKAAAQKQLDSMD